jgi:phosphonate transport system substrate-binding protein
MKKLFIVLTVLAALMLTGCGDKGSLVWVWYPNESTPEKAVARAELIKVISESLGRPIEEQLTTDYNIAIEAVVNKNAAFSWFGGEGYIQAHAKNPKVLPLCVDSGPSGTLKDAKYYSMLVVLKDNGPLYMSGDKFSIDNIAGKKFSFVSTSSTSGFRVPTSVISKYFGAKPEWTGMKAEDLIEGGKNKLFSEVMFGGSHQGSMLNLIQKKSDVSAFCNMCVAPAYVEWVEGSFDDPKPGDLIRIKQGAADPFDKLVGVEMRLISATPVLNAPMVVNTEMLSKEELDKLIKDMTSDQTANNEKIFVPKGSKYVGLGFQKGVRFVEVDDAWYNPIRELAGMK